MKTRHSVLCVVLLLFSPLLVLAQIVDGTSNTIVQPRALPDLVPADMTVDAIPDSEYAHVAGNAVVQMYKGGAGWGEAILGGIDPGKGTQPAGGTVVSTWWTAAANLTLPLGTHVLKVDVDNNHHLAEANEGNNSLMKTLACQNALDQPPTSTKP